MSSYLLRRSLFSMIWTRSENTRPPTLTTWFAAMSRKNADASLLRAHVLTQQQFDRIYFYVSLEQIKNVDERVAFIHENMLFSDWWHTDELIGYVADLDFEATLKYAAEK